MQDPRASTSKPNMLDDLIGATHARVSTAKQKDGISLDDQDDGTVLYTAQQSIVVPDDYRFKEQESGFKMDNFNRQAIPVACTSRSDHTAPGETSLSTTFSKTKFTLVRTTQTNGRWSKQRPAGKNATSSEGGVDTHCCTGDYSL